MKYSPHRIQPTSPWGAVRLTYELAMAGLAVAVIWLLSQPETTAVHAANLVIWGIFAADYFTGLVIARDRRRYVRTHVPELIAALPLDFLRIARVARVARVVRLVRAASVLLRVSRNMRGILGTNGLGYVLIFNAFLVLAGGAVIQQNEARIETFGDGVWWSIVTTTTVGYGDLAPESAVGRVAAVFLMLVGIGTLGMVTATLATYFLRGRRRDINPDVAHICERLGDWTNLDVDERRQLARMLSVIADESNSVHPAEDAIPRNDHARRASRW